MRVWIYGLLRARLVIAWALFASVFVGAHAMTLQRQGNTLFATGPVENDFGLFRDALEVPGLEQIVFVNSPGGDLWTGMRVGRMIQSQGVRTVTAGYCVSACSIMFMGGKERMFSDAFRPAVTYVGLHGPHNKNTKAVNTDQSPQIFAFFKNAMGTQFNAELMNKAFYEMDDAGALLRVFDVARTPKRVTYHCRSSQTQRVNCTDFPQWDALSLGVVTRTELMPVTIPPDMLVAPKVMGYPLDASVADPVAFLTDIANKSCTSDGCKKLVQNYQNLKENRAIVVAVDGPGVGTTADRDSPNQAVLAALFACNHIKDRPTRLCTAVGINGFDTRAAVATARASHDAGLAALAVPKDKFYGNEQFGGAFTDANGLRYDKYTDATPSKVDGIQVVGTGEVVALMKADTMPVVIDVSLAEDVLPGSAALFFGGVAYQDATKDAPLEQRITSLLKLLAPDLQRRLIFTGAGRDDWRGLNAAMRARKAGYTQVGWYRGGLLAWKDAGLPVAKVIVNAVAN